MGNKGDMEPDRMYSIIVVCLNAGQRLYETVDSILGQSYQNFEVVIKDGGSSDGSAGGIAKRYQDERIRVCIEKDNGIYDAMNQAVKLATGTYFLFLNAGDSFYDGEVLDKITHEIHRLEKEDKKADIIYGNMYHRALNTIIYASPEINDFTCYRNVPCHQTCFYHRSLFDSRGYRAAYTVRADYEHFLWCYYERKAKITYVPVVIASYEGGGYSETKENRKRSGRQHREIVVRYMGKRKADRYRLVMLLTLAPLRGAIAESRYLSGVYNGIKTAIYRLRKHLLSMRRPVP